MPIALETWMPLIEREYLATFVPDGGGVTRFVVANDEVIAPLSDAMRSTAVNAGLSVIAIDTAATRLHMLHFVFFAVVEALDWQALLQNRLERLVGEAGYRWPDLGKRVTFSVLAEHNGVAPSLLRTTMQQQMTHSIWEDARLAQDFRNAMIALLDAQLTDDQEGLGDSVLRWLRGEPGSLRWVKNAQIGARIGRHNARAMLVSLCHWLRSCGHRGLVVMLDIRRLLRDRREVSDGIVYTPAAVMDCYEVIRQLIDDAEHLEGLFLMVLADPRLVNDEVPKRALSQYTALKMRVWDDVRPQGQDNPLSPLVVIAP